MHLDLSRLTRTGSRLLLGGALLAAAIAKSFLSIHGTKNDNLFESIYAGHPHMRSCFLVFEAMLGIWVISGARIKISALLSTALVSFFTGLMMSELFKQDPKACGCFGQQAATASADIRVALVKGIALNSLLLFAGFLLLVGRNLKKLQGA